MAIFTRVEMAYEYHFKKFLSLLITTDQHRLFAVELAVAGLEFSFQTHTEIDQIDDFPRIQLPAAFDFARLRDAHN